MKVFSTIITLVSCYIAAAQAAFPTILSPANGTVIQPGASFAWQYAGNADYGVSSYNYTVWLLTSPPSGEAGIPSWASGYYLGRFAEENYPGNPYPVNPAPPTLVMPNFAKLGGGFGVGAAASNIVVWIAVVEEWLNGAGNVGYHLGLTYNHILYNATAH